MSLSPFYNSARWRGLRSRVLRRDGYQSQLSKRYGKNVPANVVHHIFPRDQFPEYQWEPWNLISVTAEEHNKLHDRGTQKLSSEGWALLIRTAKKKGIEVKDMLPQRTLVIGLPGSGKTTYCQHHLQDGLAYDLDLIAQAFRLGDTSRHDGARRMANDLLMGFVDNANDYAGNVFIIRTAPTIQELEDIEPTRVVYCQHQYIDRGYDTGGAELRLREAISYCTEHGIPVISPPAP